MSTLSHALRQRRVGHAHALLRRERDPLLAAVGDIGGRDVLVLGAVVASTMCALAVSDCRRAESRLPGCRVEAGAADIVLVPLLPPEGVPGIVRQATVALSRGGLLALRLPRAGGRPAATLRPLLEAAGFARLREVAAGGEHVLLAEAPGFHVAR